MLENKYIVLKQSQQEYMAVEIDVNYARNRAFPWVIAPKQGKWAAGDIVERANDNDYVIKQYHDCEPAIVTSANMINGEDINKSYKLVRAFCKEYGDIRLTLRTNNPFFYTERGDEIMIRRYDGFEGISTYKIATNKTVDKMRAEFLQRQQQKQK